jgi:hypothetical protein
MTARQKNTEQEKRENLADVFNGLGVQWVMKYDTRENPDAR